MKIIPRFRSSAKAAKHPQQRLRVEVSDLPLHDVDFDNEEEEFEATQLFLDSLEALHDDYGSYEPIVGGTVARRGTVTLANSLESNSAEAAHDRLPALMVLDNSLESNSSELSIEVTTVNISDFLELGKDKVNMITSSLTRRIEIGSESGISSFYQMVTPSGLSDLASCTSDDTEAWNNLSSRLVGTDVSSTDLAEIANTFAGREESFVDDTEQTNSLCELDASTTEELKKPNILVTALVTAASDIELVYSTSSLIDTSITQSSEAESSLSASSRTSSSSDLVSSSSCNSSQGILLPPKRAIVGYDPFGKDCSDFSVPEAGRGNVTPQPQPRRRVQFSNMSKVKEGGSAIEKIMKEQTPGNIPSSDWSDSTASIDYLIDHLCGIEIVDDPLLEV